jgi:adenylyltransferase/sulfurtransferase
LILKIRFHLPKQRYPRAKKSFFHSSLNLPVQILLKKMLNEKQKQRYARQTVLDNFGDEKQEKLLRSSVFVAGAGGLAAPLLPYLAAAGVGTIGIADGDLVSESNLQRQIIFSEKDLGKNKAEVAAEKLKTLNSGINIHFYPFFADENNLLELMKDYDIVIDCTDNFTVRYLLNDAALMLQKPLIYAAVNAFEGQVAVFNSPLSDGRRSCNLRDLFPEPPAEGVVRNCAENGVLGVAVGIIGTLQAAETIKILTGIGTPLINKVLIYNILECRQFVLNLPPVSRFHAPAKLEKSISQTCELTPESIFFDQKERFPASFLLLDVREKFEYDEKNIGAKNFPLSDIKTGKIPAIEEKNVLIHCKSGMRSAEAVKILREFFPEKKFLNVIFRQGELMN